MSIEKVDPAKWVAESLNSDPAASAEGLLQKFFVRWKLIVACAILAPAMALLLALSIPPVYKSSAQLLIRHQGGTQAIYTDFTPDLTSLSGASAAEVLRSEPVASKMIRQTGVQEADIARPAYKMLFRRIASVVVALSGKESEPSPADSDLKYRELAKDMKPSIEATTLMVDRGSAMARDEIIDVTIKSTNRLLVAPMVNGLCQAFMAEYDQRIEKELAEANQLLDLQAKGITADLQKLNASADQPNPGTGTEFSDSLDNRPLASNLARNISDLEVRLVQLRQVYAASAPEVINAQKELTRARAILGNQQSIDSAETLLGSIRKKQRQLALAAELLRQNQSDISMVESGLTPRKSKAEGFIRFGAPIIGGFFGGLMIGVVGVLVLNLLDPRLLVATDVTTNSGLPLLGVIPSDSIGLPSSPAAVEKLPHLGARPALLQALGKFDVLAADASRIIVVTTAENEASSASVALQLAVLLARDRGAQVVLIDADFDRAQLTRALQDKAAPGLLDALSGAVALAAVLRPTAQARLSFVGIGKAELRDEVGSNREAWNAFLAGCERQNYLLVVSAGGLLTSREGAALAKKSSHPLLVTDRRLSKRTSLRRAAKLLSEISVPALGVIHCDVKR